GTFQKRHQNLERLHLQLYACALPAKFGGANIGFKIVEYVPRYSHIGVEFSIAAASHGAYDSRTGYNVCHGRPTSAGSWSGFAGSAHIAAGLSASRLERRMTDPLLVVILGPTASGKTGLSLRLGDRFQGEIVSCDSVAVYREFEIGTAKPSR